MIDLSKPIEARPDGAYKHVTDAKLIGMDGDCFVVAYTDDYRVAVRFTQSAFYENFRNVWRRGRCWGFFYNEGGERVLAGGWNRRDIAEAMRDKKVERGQNTGPVFEIVEPENT